jgi:hypothetical protein
LWSSCQTEPTKMNITLKLTGIPRFGHSAVLLPEFQRLFFFGGFDTESNSITDKVLSKTESSKENFDPAVFSQCILPNEIGGLQFSPAISLGTSILCFGGNSDGGVKTDLFELQTQPQEYRSYVLNFVSNHNNGSPPSARYGHSFTQNPQTKYIYLFGGYLAKSETSSELFRFDPLFKEWDKLVPEKQSPIPTSRYHHAATVIQDRLIIFGGSSASNTLFQDLWAFDFATKQWTEIVGSGVLPSPRCGHSMIPSFTNQDEFYVIGGKTDTKTDKESQQHTFYM